MPSPAPPACPARTAASKVLRRYGNVEIRAPTEVVRGERGVYDPIGGMARILGNVRITRGENQLNGQEAIVNLQTAWHGSSPSPASACRA